MTVPFFARILIKKLNNRVVYTGKRYLMSSFVLRLKSFTDRSEEARKLYNKEKRDEFISNMAKMCEKSSLVTEENLLKMIYLAESDADIDLCASLAEKYQEANGEKAKKLKEMRDEIRRKDYNRGFKKDDDLIDFNFGPPFLRMLYINRKVDHAIKIMENEKTKELLGHVSAYVIYLDLLYEEKRYEKCVSVFEDICHISDGQIYTLRNHQTIALAALYQMNTQEALEKATNLIRHAYHQKELITSPRSRAYAAALALKQDNPRHALEILELSVESNFVQSLNSALKIMSLARMDETEKTIKLLTKFHDQIRKKFDQPVRLFHDVLDEVGKMTERSGDKELIEKFLKIKSDLQEANLIKRTTVFQQLNDTIQNSVGDKEHFKYLRKKRYSNSQNERRLYHKY